MAKARQRSEHRGFWSWMLPAWTFFEKVLQAVKTDLRLTVLWGFGVLLLIALISVLVLGGLSSEMQLAAIVVIVGTIAILFVYTVSKLPQNSVHEQTVIGSIEANPDRLPGQILDTVEEILGRINEFAVENQEALRPLYRDPPDLNQVRRKLLDLWQVQRGRGLFGKWQAFLQASLNNMGNPQVRVAIHELLEVLGGLHVAFYSNKDPISKMLDRYPRKKGLLVYALDRKGIEAKEFRTKADEYLEFLRESVQKIGHIAGDLKVLLKR